MASATSGLRAAAADGDGSGDDADDNGSMHSAVSEAGCESLHAQREDGAEISDP
jgi:hypothetical protein